MSERMTDEQREAYVAGADARVEEARAIAQRAIDSGAPPREVEETYRDLRAAQDHAKGARLDVYGIPCPRCDGTGSLPGRMPWDSHDCPACGGWYRVMPEVAEQIVEAMNA